MPALVGMMVVNVVGFDVMLMDALRVLNLGLAQYLMKAAMMVVACLQIAALLGLVSLSFLLPLSPAVIAPLLYAMVGVAVSLLAAVALSSSVLASVAPLSMAVKTIAPSATLPTMASLLAAVAVAPSVAVGAPCSNESKTQAVKKLFL